jgi:hypothetical protein
MSPATEATVKRFERALALMESDAPPMAVRFDDDEFVTRDGEEIPLDEWSQEPQRVTISIVLGE